MDQQPAFTFQDVFTHVIGDMAKAISERSDEAQDQQFVRSGTAVHMILGFLPRDVPEVMLAGHCVMLHEIMTANVHSTLCSDAEPRRRGADGGVVGLNKAFNETLDRLERYQQRPAEGSRDVADQQPASASDDVAPMPGPPTDTPMLGPTLNRAARRHAARAETRTAAATSRSAAKQAVVTPQRAVQAQPPIVAHRTPAVAAASPEAIAACNANQDAMAALNSGDPAGFARALGIAHPSEAFLAAATAKGSPFIPTAPFPSSSGAG
jgi:hypothetical protein